MAPEIIKMSQLIPAHFDGERILLDEPVELEPNTKLTVTVLSKSSRERFTATIWREGDLHIAQCREFEIASQGVTREEAIHNLSEAIGLHFEPPVASVFPEVVTLEAEVERGDA